MAHVIHSINTTASGSCYHLDSAVDVAHLRYAIDLTLSADTLIFGRNTFDLFMDFWPDAVNDNDLPEQTQALAKALYDVPKIVVSKRPVNLSWHNTRHLPWDSLADAVRSLQGKAVIFGSPSLASSLLNEKLVDEIHLLCQPYIGVEGPHAYSGVKERVDLRLMDANPLASGQVRLRYTVV